ncbi:MAG: T9SS type A sorting domain-containing protein [Calditrichaeota bacterium]|nr:T9SS type A sorting domain-containing protein [Calditrichota bacterium]
MKINHLYFATSFIFLLYSVGYSQPDTVWTRSYGTPLIDRCVSVSKATNSGYFLGGLSSNGDNYFWLIIRVDSLGNELWRYTDPQQGSYCAHTIAMPDGGCIATGAKIIYRRGYDARIQRLNNDGDVIWDHCYGGQFQDRGVKIIRLVNGEFLMVGGFEPGIIDFDTWILRFNEDGDSLDSYIIDDRAGFAGAADFFINGNDITVSGTYGAAGACLAKLNLEGNIQWIRNYPLWERVSIRSSAPTLDGGCILVGFNTPDNESNADAIMIRTAENGDTLWTRIIVEDGTNLFASVIPVQGDGHLIAGVSSIVDPDGDAILYRLSENGELLWQQNYGLEVADRFYSSIQLADGSFVNGGSININNGDFWLIKTESDPNEISAPHNVYLPDKFSILFAYPNPFNSVTKFDYQVFIPGQFDLKIFNHLGQEVYRMNRGYHTTGVHSLIWNAQGFESGCYNAVIHNGNSVSTSKLILIK